MSEKDTHSPDSGESREGEPRADGPREELSRDKDAWRATTDDVPGGTGATGPSLLDEAWRLFGSMRERVAEAVEPLRSESPEVLTHLQAAGNELLAAYRAAVSKHEKRWSAPIVRTERVHLDDEEDETRAPGAGPSGSAGRSSTETVEIDEDDEDDVR